MKSIEKVIYKHINDIEKNNLNVVDYIDKDNIECICNKCGYKIIDNYRNLSYKNFKCKYCILLNSSELIKNGSVVIQKIEGSDIYLTCKNGHNYKQDRRNLLKNKYCQRCYLDNKIIGKESVIKKFKDIHGDRYTYDFNDFKNLHSIINITCPKGHVFTQKVSNHLQGKACPICRESIGERTIANYLTNKDIDFIRQKKFKDCIYTTHLPFDFYLPNYNICIEYDGIQHFQPTKIFGGETEFNKTKIKDAIKTKYCIFNKIKLIRISYRDNILDILESHFKDL